jgi:serine/threonine protein kinase
MTIPNRSASSIPKGASVASVIPVQQFLKSLADNGLLSAQEIKQEVARLPARIQQNTAELAKALVHHKLLTGWQASMLTQGKAKVLTLGNYVLLEKLGSGGMGIVFKAQHRRMKRVVAIKVVNATVTKSPKAVQRFLREVEASGKLNHPNIVAAFDADEADGVPFLVMEFVDGIDLSGLVKKDGPLPVDKAVRYILQAARGLESAHAAHIVHRDIKPGNLLVDGQGTVKVLDLGMARFASDQSSTPVDELTKSGSIMGTCDFMSPEQALNTKHADERSDIYSLGCTLFYILTGHPMYQGETAMEKFMGHRSAPIPSLRRFRADVPKMLDTVYQRMVAKDPVRRQQSMQEVIVDLEALAACVKLFAIGPPDIASSSTIHRPGPSPYTWFVRGLRWWLLAAASGLIALVLLISLVYLAVTERSSEKQLSLATSPRPKLVPTSTVPDTVATGKSLAPTSGTVPAIDRAWCDQVATLPAEKQIEAVARKLQERNPEFNGKIEHQIDKGQVIELRFLTDAVSDITPLRALRHLQRLTCRGSREKNGKLIDLSPLQGLPLIHLECRHSRITDLSPLRGMQLISLDCSFNYIGDIGPLRGMPLTKLNFSANTVTDLSPLQGMRLTSLRCDTTRVKDLTPLRGMPLTSLNCGYTEVVDLSPLEGLPLKELYAANISKERNLAIVRAIKTLERIEGDYAADFWKKHPAK